MSTPAQVPSGFFSPRPAGEFAGSLAPQDMVYFLCNVGDGDSQLLLLPEDDSGERRVVIVDSAVKNKIPWLLEALGEAELVRLDAAKPIELVVATHPHKDHIGGIPHLLATYGERVHEFWDCGYFHTSPSYFETMSALEDLKGEVLYAQPTSGLRRWIGHVGLTVLAPSIQLRNRYDTYGTDPNDASISLRVEYPAGRVSRDGGGESADGGGRASVTTILGADAQTLSWSYVQTDFPELQKSHSEVARAIGGASGKDPLRAKVLKVSHHGSKRGLNLELVERVGPALTFVSCARSSKRYNFPHTLAQDIVREGVESTAKSGRAHRPDHELGIFYTCDVETNGQPLGSIAVAMRNSTCRVWRFGDRRQGRVDLNKGRSRTF